MATERRQVGRDDRSLVAALGSVLGAYPLALLLAGQGPRAVRPLGELLLVGGVCLGALIVGVLLIASGSRTPRGSGVRLRCPSCGYPARDDPGWECPECGTTQRALPASRMSGASRFGGVLCRAGIAGVAGCVLMVGVLQLLPAWYMDFATKQLASGVTISQIGPLRVHAASLQAASEIVPAVVELRGEAGQARTFTLSVAGTSQTGSEVDAFGSWIGAILGANDTEARWAQTNFARLNATGVGGPNTTGPSPWRLTWTSHALLWLAWVGCVGVAVVGVERITHRRAPVDRRSTGS